MTHHDINASVRTLQRALKKNTRESQMYKQAYTNKVISAKNLAERVEYGKEHGDKSIDDFWQYIFFTDEAHIDPTSVRQGLILRELGTRYDPPNIGQRPPLKGVRLHIAAWINWHSKAEKLEFYNDEKDYIQRPQRPPKPRKTMYETDEDYNQRSLEWKASAPHPREVKPKGNSMTEKYYCQRLLLVYMNAVHQARLKEPQPWLLQEDNDSSHGTRTYTLARQLKDANWIDTLRHPAQSPDLNPMEAAWNILKQRVRRRAWETLEDLKGILQEEWSKITMEEVRARIRDMPRRCQVLVSTGGKPIKTAQW